MVTHDPLDQSGVAVMFVIRMFVLAEVLTPDALPVATLIVSEVQKCTESVSPTAGLKENKHNK